MRSVPLSHLASLMSDDVMFEKESQLSSVSSHRSSATDRVWSMDQIQSKVAKSVAKVVSIGGVEEEDYHTSLFDMGLDSLGTTELATILQETFDVTLSSTLVFNYPTIADLTNHLHGILLPYENLEVTPSTKHSGQNNRSDFSIVGMSCRFPR